MANYANLLATIAANVYQNGNNEVTATMVQTAMNNLVNAFAQGYQLMGVASPAAAGTYADAPDGRVCWIAGVAGTYPDFNNLVVNPGEVVLFKWDTSWHKEVTGAASAAGRVVFNISELFPTGGTGGTNVYTRAAARAMCTAGSGLRRLGAVLTYLTADGWVVEEFVGAATSAWNTASNWKDLTEGSNVFVYTMGIGETRAQVRNKVPYPNRKPGTIVIYHDGLAWCVDQYINADVSLWSTSQYSVYWSNILKAGQSPDKAHGLQMAQGLTEQGISVTGTPGQRGAVYSVTLASGGVWALSFKFKFPKNIQQVADQTTQLAKLDNLVSNAAAGGFCIDLVSALPTARAPFAQPSFNAGLNFFAIAQKDNNFGVRVRPDDEHNKQFVGRDAVSIRYAGDITQTANQDVVLTIDSTGLTIKHSTDDSVILSEPFPVSKAMNEWAATLATKCASGGAYEGIIEFDYIFVEGQSTDDLLRVSNIPLVGDYTSQSASKGVQAFPCFLPYFDDEWHRIDVRLDFNKSTVREALVCLLDGMEITNPSTAIPSLSGNGIFEATFTLGGADILVKDFKYETNKTKLDVPKIIVGMTHNQADGVYDPNTPDGYMTIGRMQYLLATFAKHGFKFVPLPEIAAYINGQGEVPEKCYTIIFDDKYYLADWTDPLSNKFRRLLMGHNAKASFALTPIAIDTDDERAAINKDKDFFCFHAHDNAPTAEKYKYADFMTHFSGLLAGHRDAVGATNIYTYMGGLFDVNVLHLFRRLGICYSSVVGGNYVHIVNASGTGYNRKTNTYTALGFDALRQPRLSLDDNDLTESELEQTLSYLDSI